MSDRTDVTRANLDLLERETDALLRTVDRLPDDAIGAASLCAGWTRAHVVTHVARNAEALLNLVRWAVDGTERESYPSEEDRARAIEEGAARTAGQLRQDLRTTAGQFAAEAEQLLGPAGSATVRTRAGTQVSGAQVVGMRLLEIVFHHVDLDAGYSFEDADGAWVARTLRRGARQWSAREGAPTLVLLPDKGEPLRVGPDQDEARDGQEVRGSAGALLLWLARGVAGGVTSDAPLPAPPPWA